MTDVNERPPRFIFPYLRSEYDLDEGIAWLLDTDIVPNFAWETTTRLCYVYNMVLDVFSIILTSLCTLPDNSIQRAILAFKDANFPPCPFEKTFDQQACIMRQSDPIGPISVYHFHMVDSNEDPRVGAVNGGHISLYIMSQFPVPLPDPKPRLLHNPTYMFASDSMLKKAYLYTTYSKNSYVYGGRRPHELYQFKTLRPFLVPRN
jgi:hypothetical protein